VNAAEFNAREVAAGRVTAEHLSLVGGLDSGEYLLRVRRWQDDHGLEADGKLGPMTRAEMDRELDRLAQRLVTRCIPVAPWLGHEAKVSCGFGPRQTGQHWGADLMIPWQPGEPLPPGQSRAYKLRWVYTYAVAAAEGRVTGVATQDNGMWLWIEHSDGMRTQYGHLHPDRVEVERGDVVAMGQRIGPPCAEAQEWPPHLHLGLSPVTHRIYRDPVPWLRAGGARV